MKKGASEIKVELSAKTVDTLTKIGKLPANGGWQSLHNRILSRFSIARSRTILLSWKEVEQIKLYSNSCRMPHLKGLFQMLYHDVQRAII